MKGFIHDYVSPTMDRCVDDEFLIYMITSMVICSFLRQEHTESLSAREGFRM